jgi:fatty-acyl-CoA synthase
VNRGSTGLAGAHAAAKSMFLRRPPSCYFPIMRSPSRDGVPQCTLEQFETAFAGRHLLHRVVTYWAERKPRAPALVSYDRKEVVDWATLEQKSTALALELIRRGFRKGDFLAASLPQSIEHICLEYACFKIGVIHTPLDLRFKPQELLRCMEMIRPKGFAFPAPEAGRAVAEHCPSIECFFTRMDLNALVWERAQSASPALESALAQATAGVDENDGAQVIFTTGSTGSPKPALLSHRNITSQNFCLGTAFQFPEQRLLLNLPSSHVGGQAEVLMSALYFGSSVVILESFDPAKSLDAIQQHRVTLLGQIPAMFQFEWRLPDFARYDLSSLRTVVYGGQQVSRQFLEGMARMAPLMGTGLGLTETAGFCTYTPLTSSVDDLLAGIGQAMPLYPLSIRREIHDDGSAGNALPDGEVGHICFHGPQTFLGYVRDPVSTARAISTDGHLYTGDLGWKDHRGLHLSGRAKWVIKPGGNQVFPGDVESHICALGDQVISCGAVGAEHKLLSEAIVAFVEAKPGAGLSVAELRRHARGMTSYMRPLHYVILEPGQLPLNRAAKIDYVRLSEMARQEIESLRSKGGWDR